jgi:hypothetical protein
MNCFKIIWSKLFKYISHQLISLYIEIAINPRHKSCPQLIWSLESKIVRISGFEDLFNYGIIWKWDLKPNTKWMTNLFINKFILKYNYESIQIDLHLKWAQIDLICWTQVFKLIFKVILRIGFCLSPTLLLIKFIKYYH